jgi:hypothetical protein
MSAVQSIRALAVAVAASLMLSTSNPAVRAAAPAAAPPKVEITNKIDALIVGQSYTFRATCDPPDGTIKWTVRDGTTRITPTSGTGATFTITVIAASERNEEVRLMAECHGREDRCALTTVEFVLESASYGGAGFRAVVQDRGGAYGSPQYNDGAVNKVLGNRTFPLLYVRGSTVSIAQLTCKVKPSTFATDRDIALKGTELLDQTCFSGTGRLAAGRVTSSKRMDGSKALAANAHFIDTWQVFWEASLDGTNFMNIGISDNRLYVSLASPANVTLYETVVHLACAEQTGATTQAQVVAGIWPTFQSRKVHRKPVDGFGKRDHLRLSYYVPAQQSCLTYAQLVGSPIGNGQCGAWGQLLQATTRVHGMDKKSESNLVFALPTKSVGNVDVPTVVNRGGKRVTIQVSTPVFPDGFLVREWRFTDTHVHTGLNGRNDSTRRLDDNEIVRPGEGFPHTIGVRARTGRTITTDPGGDDVLVGNTEIWTGPDGICDTQANPATEIQLIPLTQGQPNRPCILPGGNGRIDSTVRLDDMTSTGGNGAPPLFPNEIGKTALNLPGIPGQHNPEPPEAFANHVFCEILGELYDPSYGAGPFGGATRDNDYENAAIAGLKKLLVARPNDRLRVDLDYVRQ